MHLKLPTVRFSLGKFNFWRWPCKCKRNGAFSMRLNCCWSRNCSTVRLSRWWRHTWSSIEVISLKLSILRSHCQVSVNKIFWYCWIIYRGRCFEAEVPYTSRVETEIKLYGYLFTLAREEQPGTRTIQLISYLYHFIPHCFCSRTASLGQAKWRQDSNSNILCFTCSNGISDRMMSFCSPTSNKKRPSGNVMFNITFLKRNLLKYVKWRHKNIICMYTFCAHLITNTSSYTIQCIQSL